MKRIIAVAALALSFSAMADQCSYISPVMAKRATTLIRPGSEVVRLCELCGETVAHARPEAVRSIKVEKRDSFRQVMINGSGVDLAYLFVRVAPNRYANVAKSVGCRAEGVSTQIRL